ncbi:MAG: bifunctional prephenate dehydrogenase/3-phosphoshikimate 1-carboxyvinyltransferase, partial [Pseudomonadota bacterium]|nr:bifunctional prephenate dehydrogenase/3-phosphoshikimate 1-carboxyvinyltransferase [Pseudomonadota bacterium]
MVEPCLSYFAYPADSVGGVISVPGDKSISHRALMLGAVAEGVTQIEGILRGEDCVATLVALEKMGVSINHGPDGAVVIKGVGLQGLSAPLVSLDLGNSGTAMRLLTGLLASQSFEATLTGDQSLRGRPMARVVKPLQAMGAKIETEDGYPPVLIQCIESLIGVSHKLKIASAQVKSALL